MSKTEGQKRADKIWKNKHKQQQNYYVDKSKTKHFILKESKIKDLNKVDHWSHFRRRYLHKLK